MNDYEELLLKSFLAGLGRWRAVSAPGRCVSLLTILSVMVSMRVFVCAFVRAFVCAFYCSPWRDCVVHAQCYVRLGLCVRLCMRECDDLPPSLRFRTAPSCNAS